MGLPGQFSVTSNSGSMDCMVIAGFLFLLGGGRAAGSGLPGLVGQGLPRLILGKGMRGRKGCRCFSRLLENHLNVGVLHQTFLAEFDPKTRLFHAAERGVRLQCAVFVDPDRATFHSHGQ
jgi:hypothetical protein